MDIRPRRFRPSRLSCQPGRPHRRHQDRPGSRTGSGATNRCQRLGVTRILHTFTGVRSGDSRNQRDCILTSVWAWSMDAVAVGLIIMVFGSYYMWWRLPQKRAWGIVALMSGWMACAFFISGLRLLL